MPLKLSALADFYRGKTVFITGHTGFKGAWLAAWLESLGAKVVGYALAPPSQPSLFDLLGLEKKIQHIQGDVRRAQDVAKAIGDAQPEIVFHLAAQSLVRPSYRNPAETFDTNVMGTVNVLEGVRQARTVRVCEVITSDKCYDNREWDYAYRENDPMGGYDPYSASKGAAELVVASYRNSFFNPAHMEDHGVSLASTRAGNVIGGGDWAEDRIIPDCVRALGKQERIKIRSPHAIRPWQHVLEPLSGYLLLAMQMWHEPARFAQAWNFGPTSTGNVTVRNIVDQVVHEWGEGGWDDVSTQNNRGPHEATFLKLDCSKAMTLLGWRPVYSVADSVRETVQWYRQRHRDKNFRADRFTLGQIETYTNKAREIEA